MISHDNKSLNISDYYSYRHNIACADAQDKTEDF